MSEEAKNYVVVVDDDPLLAKLTARMAGLVLKENEEAPEFLLAQNGKEALSIIQENREAIGLILSDTEMPEMDGMTLADKLDGTIPFVLLSGNHFYEKINRFQKLLEAGKIHAFVRKPYSRDTFLAGIQQARAAVGAKTEEAVQKSEEE